MSLSREMDTLLAIKRNVVYSDGRVAGYVTLKINWLLLLSDSPDPFCLLYKDPLFYSILLFHFERKGATHEQQLY